MTAHQLSLFDINAVVAKTELSSLTLSFSDTPSFPKFTLNGLTLKRLTQLTLDQLIVNFKNMDTVNGLLRKVIFNCFGLVRLRVAADHDTRYFDGNFFDLESESKNIAITRLLRLDLKYPIS